MAQEEGEAISDKETFDEKSAQKELERMLTGDCHKDYVEKFGAGTVAKYAITVFLVLVFAGVIYEISPSIPDGRLLLLLPTILGVVAIWRIHRHTGWEKPEKYPPQLQNCVVERAVFALPEDQRNVVYPLQRPQPRMLWIVPFRVEYMNYIAHKQNWNILIFGMIRVGKSSLMKRLITTDYDYKNNSGGVLDTRVFQFAVFNLKPDDHYMQLPNETRKKFRLVDCMEELPNPFADDYSFHNAFMVAFPLAQTTIQPAHIGPLLIRLGRKMKGKDWDYFDTALNELDKEIKKTEYNLREAFVFVREQSIFIRTKTAKGLYTLGTENVVYDLSGFGTNESGKMFYLELVLRQIWESIHNQGRENVIIVVDEMDRLLSNPNVLEKRYQTILADIISQVGDRNVWCWTSVHSYTNVIDEYHNMFGTHWAFKSANQLDIRALDALDTSGKLGSAVGNLPPYHFTDALFPARGDFIPIYYIVDKKLSERLERKPRPPIPPTPPTAPFNYRSEIIARLEVRPRFTAELMREFIKAQKLPEKDKKIEDMVKGNITRVLGELEQEDYRKKQFDYYGAGPGSQVMLYWKAREDYPESELHKYMVNEIASLIIKYRPQWTENWKVDTSRGTAVPDIQTAKIDFEMETGFSRGNITSLLERIAKSIKDEKSIRVVVPNYVEKENYLHLESDFKLGTSSNLLPESVVNVQTFGELKKELKGDEANE